jgi:H+/Cl- antiporter ClcA
MIGAVGTGLLAAFVVTLPYWIQSWAPDLSSPVFVLGVASVAMVIQRFVVDRRSGSRTYDGMADLFIHIHSPSSPDSALRWAMRGVTSLLLSICGGTVGPEGGAVEFGHALALATRARSARWFEQRRRTDASTALAAGVSAAFGAPFAGFLLPIELGMGGRAITAVIGSLIAFLAARLFKSVLGLTPLDFSGPLSGLRFLDARAWLGALIVGVGAGVLCAGIVRFFRYAQDSLLDLFQTQAWMRTLCAGVLLFLVILTYRSGHVQASALLEQVLSMQRTPSEAWLLLAMGTLSLAVVLAGFGTVGVFWPLFALGGFFGTGMDAWLLHGVSGVAGVAGLAGAASFWGAVLGAPVAGAVVAYELTQNLHVLLPCLLAGLVACEVRARLRTPALIQNDLDARGMTLIEGRSAGVLEAVSVRDAMVTDHEIVHEQEPVSEIYPRLLKSRYPFLPVVNSQNVYIGLLTVDLVQEAWQTQTAHANSSLAKLLEAKDLLYRSGLRTPTVKANDRLSAARGVFETVPCVPVLSDDGRVLGLLFIHNVRLAYDREVARRSLTFEDRDS